LSLGSKTVREIGPLFVTFRGLTLIEDNQLTPVFVLVLFIVATLALAWAAGTLFLYFRARSSGAFVAFVDLLFVGAFIAAVYELRGITKANCGNFATNNSIYLNLGPFGYVGRQTGNHLADNLHKNCSMLKASFAFGIMNTIFFFFTMVSTDRGQILNFILIW
jgi:hypothetical protein